jgi:hypothetical protein
MLIPPLSNALIKELNSGIKFKELIQGIKFKGIKLKTELRGGSHIKMYILFILLKK